MYNLHLTRNLRSIAFLMVVAAIITGIGMLWWANRTGMPASWRAAIENEISKQGAYVRIGGLSYNPLRGVIATKVSVFSDATRLHEISKLENVVLDFDKTKLARGDVKITKIEFVNVTLIMPVDPNNPDSETLEIKDANGLLFMPGNRRFEIRNASGTIAGIRIVLDARIIGFKDNPQHVPDRSQEGKRRQLIARIIGELKRWRFDPDQPPQLRIVLNGDANQPDSLEAKLSLTAKGVKKNNHTLELITADSEITGNLLTITSLQAKDPHGELHGHADYNISNREGRFDIHSSLEIPSLLKNWFGTPPIKEITIGGSQTIDAEGSFLLEEGSNPRIQMTGHAACNSVKLRDVRFKTVKCAFSWNGGDLFLRDVVLQHAEGEVRGKAMIQRPLVRLAMESTIPGAILRPFFVGQPLEKVIDDFSNREGSSYLIRLEGGFDTTNPQSWAYTGGGIVKNVSYKGVPVNSAECRFSLSHHELDFFDGTVVFNYQDYPLRKEFNGPKQSTSKVGRIRYVAATKTVDVEDVTGTFWAAPMVRLFAPKIADAIEIYRFHTPPELKGSGVVDVTPQGRTALDVSFNGSAANYRFLGEDVTLLKPVGKVSIRGDRVTVDPLKLEAFDGPIKASFDVRDKGRLSGDMSWTRLSLPALSSTYGFNMKGSGDVTGRIEFSLTNGQVETMNGKGLLALNKAELLSVPIFGPLSPLISGVLGNRKAGFERAKSAFCNFKIKDGILSTRDFQTATTSLVFTGDGSIDLKERTIDMTMRLNARGLLGLLTWPLSPFYNMFQFRGTGPLKETKWENVMFTSPPDEQGEILLAPPKAKIVGDRN